MISIRIVTVLFCTVKPAICFDEERAGSQVEASFVKAKSTTNLEASSSVVVVVDSVVVISDSSNIMCCTVNPRG